LAVSDGQRPCLWSGACGRVCRISSIECVCVCVCVCMLFAWVCCVCMCACVPVGAQILADTKQPMDVRMWAVEGTAYVSIFAEYKDRIANDAALLDALFSLAKV
jgi:hypothetical protein